MNIFSLDDYKMCAGNALKDTGAFLRVSRGEGLFVTDAKRHGADMEMLKEKLPSFAFSEKDGLVYLTPDYGFSSETNLIYTEILKSSGERQEKLIRQNLSKAMRTKNKEQIALFGCLYERMSDI